MDLQWLTGLVGFAFAMAATPGPNNSLVTASGAAHGMRRTLPLLLGIGGGIAVSMFLSMALGAALLTDPRVAGTLKWLGVAYLLWMAWTIATAPVGAARDPGKPQASQPLGAHHGVLLQLINPKVWVMITGAVVTYGQAAQGLGPVPLALVFALIFGAVTLVSTTGWALLGSWIGRWLNTPRARRRFNLTMASLLIASLLPVLLG